MSNPQIVTMPGSEEKFIVGNNGQLTPYVEPTDAEVQVHLVPIGNQITEPTPVSDVDLLAPVAEVISQRGSTAVVQTLDESPYIEPVVQSQPTPAPVVEVAEVQQSTDTQNSNENGYNDINKVNLNNIRYKVTSPTSTAIDPDSRFAKQNPIHIPMATQAELNTITENLPGLSDDMARTLNPEWVGTYYQCIEESNTTNSFVESMKIPGSLWTQRIEHNGQAIGARRAAIGDIRDQKLTGAAAIYHMQNLLNAGTSVTHPLWASGTWITLRNPTDSELNLLEETIRREKIRIGRLTLGVAFNNQTVYLIKHVFNFIKQHIYETNIKDLSSVEDKDIGDIILITDLYPLIHLMGCTIYPEGYSYKSPCLNTEPSKCGAVVSEVLQLFKLFFNKESSITTEMRRFMANPNEKHTVKDIIAYQKAVAENCSEVMDDINAGFKIVARIPTVNEYIESGERWIAEMATSIENALGTDISDSSRDHLITNQAKLTRLREYVHCFEKIIYTGSEQVVEKRADIEALFNVMSGNDEIIDSISTALSSFISRHTLTVIGIPNYVCPICKKQHNPEVSVEHSLFTPIDPLNLFFTLKDRKIYRQG